VSGPRRLIVPATDRLARLVVNSNVLSREEAQAIVARAVGFSKAESIQITINSSYQGNTRFAANQMTTSGGVVNANVVVESSFGPKHAQVTTNDLSDDSLRRTVEQSEVLARLAPDDPEAMPPLGPQQYASVPAWFDVTANLTAEDRVRAALTALGPTREARDLAAAGFVVTSAQSNAVANKAGQFAYHRSTTANYTLTVRTADATGSGWAGADDNDWSKINFAEVSKRAIDKARLSRNPVAVEPGRYTVILEPQAVADLVQLLLFYGDARSADEGRSPFVKQGGGNKIGEKIVDSRVTLISDPSDPDLLAQPYDGDGLPLSRQVWIENGVLKQLYYSRFWAKKKNTNPTGAPTSVKMLGGTASLDDMIRSTRRGILVTRLWYLREVDPRTVLYTGLTRDGTFLIENGRIAKAIRNLRFNESPLFMLNNLEMLGRPVRVAGTEAGGAVVMPPIKVRDFTFTSLSEAV
jgi:predicted Zn-dependent protease